MEPDIVKNYLDFVINLKPQFILLRNLREGKNLKSGLKRSYVKKPVTTKFYLNTLRKFYKLNKSDAFTFGEKKLMVFTQRYYYSKEYNYEKFIKKLYLCGCSQKRQSKSKK